MHLHVHLKECIFDYGPVYAFWCFAFERFNGMLGAFPTNSKQTEPQLMQTFLLQQEVFSCQMPNPFSSLNFNNDQSLIGSFLQKVSSTPANSLQLQSLSHYTIGRSDYEIRPCHNIWALPPLKEHILHNSATSDVSLMNEQLYPAYA